MLDPGAGRVRRTLEMIVYTGRVDLGGPAPDSINDRSDVVRREFIAMAPEEANAVIGVQVATNVVLYDIGGGGALNLTFAGNPTVLEET